MSLDRIFTLIDTGQISPSRAGLCKMASENTAKCLLENGFDDVFLLSTGNHRKTGCKTDEGGVYVIDTAPLDGSLKVIISDVTHHYDDNSGMSRIDNQYYLKIPIL